MRGLVYPVPDPRYPFLGVHFTRRVDGTVDVGPNAVLATAREGYRRSDLVLRDLAATLAWPGFRRLARQHWRMGLAEMRGSVSRRAFVAGARRYLPELTAADVDGRHAGVRAQALDRDGTLVDDFRISRLGGSRCCATRRPRPPRRRSRSPSTCARAPALTRVARRASAGRSRHAGSGQVGRGRQRLRPGGGAGVDRP